jgi:hypothetical protein
MSQSRVEMHYMTGFITPRHLVNFAQNQSLEPETPVVFIFPSNPSHHTSTTTLYNIKKGGGLAKLAWDLGEQGIATLGLPTTGMRNPPDKATLAFAKEAVADLWKAAGFGMHLILPIRPSFKHPQSGATYFKQTLSAKPGFEPSFWGDLEPTPNPELAAYYFEQLELLKTFLAADLDKKPLIDPVFMNAFQEGLSAKQAVTPPAWFQKPSTLKKQVRREAQEQRQAEEVKTEKLPTLQEPRSNAAAQPLLQEPRGTYATLYQAQEKARFWKTALAITVGLVTLPTVILPLLSYFFWKRAKENELIQKIEMTPEAYAEIKMTRQALRPPEFKKDNAQKPHKEIVQQASDQGLTYYLDREQARRLRFFARREKTEALRPDELAMLKQSKEESIKLKSSLSLALR